MVSMSFVTTLVFLVCLQTVLLSTVSNCAKTISMYWNTTNSIFRIDNTDHIIDVNKNNAAFEYDQVNIICPVYQHNTYSEEAEKYIIYNVSKEEYETCRITNPAPRAIAICDKPSKTMYFTITFRPFTPQPGGLEFHPGHDYYFISTSSKDDLHRRIGGRCTTHNMKVVFKVCCNENDSSYSTVSRNNSVAITSSNASNNSINGNIISNTNNINNNNNNNNENSILTSRTSNNANGVPGGPPAPVPPSIFKGGDRYYPASNNGGHSIQHNDEQPSLSPTHIPAPPFYSNFPHHTPPPYYGPLSTPKSIQKKKNKEYSDHPNEVVKNEELTYNYASTTTPATSRLTTILTWTLLTLLWNFVILPQRLLR